MGITRSAFTRALLQQSGGITYLGGGAVLSQAVNSLTEEHLHTLISDGRPESKTIEYKQELPGTSDADKKEFLADVSSLANTLGGDILFGIAATNGIPERLVGVTTSSFDEQQRRLNSIIEAGLAPRIRYSPAVIPLRSGSSVLIIRVERSWIGPHRVVFKGHDKFYGRNSAGKYELDVSELRHAFTLSETITQRIRGFRTDRIIALSNNETPIPFVNGGKLILHVLPLASFAGSPNFDVVQFSSLERRLPTIGDTGWDIRINLDGVVTYSGSEPSNKYTQLFRSGAIESVHGEVTWHDENGPGFILSDMYEPALVDCLPCFFESLQRIGCPGPAFVALTMTGVKGLRMDIGRTVHRQHGIDRDTLLLPEIEVADFTTPADQILKPLFNMIWNACGYQQSRNYNASGNWAPHR